MTLRVGVIGVGRMGQEHLRRLSGIEGAVVTAVADINEPLARQQSERYGARAYSDAEAMLEAEELGALVIATPGNCHREHAEMALVAGLPFLLEKPVAISMDDALAISDQVAAAGTITAVGYQWRNLETIPAAREALAGQSVRWPTPPGIGPRPWSPGSPIGTKAAARW